MRYSEEKIMKMLNKCSVDLSNEDIIELINSKNDLINRQQAKIERLEAKCENTQIGYNFAKADIERLDKELIEEKLRKEMLHYTVEEIEAEAIKECLNKIEQTDVSESDDYIMIKKNRFDNLVKEMVGEE